MNGKNGFAPIGYVKGMAVAFGRVYCKYGRKHPAALEMAKAEGNPARDAVALYRDEYQALGMSNDAAGIDTLRHLFALMMGFGMYESSGEHCDGRDKGVDDVKQTNQIAEAGP